MGDFEQAILHLKAAREKDPDNEHVHIEYAKHFRELGGHHEEMLIAAQRAFELQPNLFAVMVLLGEALVESGKYEPLSA